MWFKHIVLLWFLSGTEYQDAVHYAESLPKAESLRQWITTVPPYASKFCQVLPACSTFKQISLYYSSEQCSLKSITEKCQVVFI